MEKYCCESDSILSRILVVIKSILKFQMLYTANHLALDIAKYLAREILTIYTLFDTLVIAKMQI